jgi:hypothetical protein
MPQALTKLKIMISSPSNLDSERATIAKAIEKLSSEFSRDRNIVLEAFDWKRDVIPGIGEDIQDVVSSQLDYDIYIGLLGTVFGTPTKTAGSGTEAEFKAAYSQYQTNPQTVRVLFYFSTSTSDVYEVDPDELSKVISFRRSLGPKGVLYQDFPNIDELRNLLEGHIRQLISTQWDDGTWKVISRAPQNEARRESVTKPSTLVTAQIDSANSEDSDHVDRPGLIEIHISSKAASKQLQEHLHRMSKLSLTFSKEISEFGQVADPELDPEDSKRVCDSFAEKMLFLKQAFQEELPRYEASTYQLAEAVQTISEIFFEEHGVQRPELEAILTSFEGYSKVTRANREQLQRFRDLLEKSPSLTTAFRSAKKHLSRTIDDFISSYTIYLATADEISTNVRTKLWSATD